MYVFIVKMTEIHSSMSWKKGFKEWKGEAKNKPYFCLKKKEDKKGEPLNGYLDDGMEP